MYWSNLIGQVENALGIQDSLYLILYKELVTRASEGLEEKKKKKGEGGGYQENKKRDCQQGA